MYILPHHAGWRISACRGYVVNRIADWPLPGHATISPKAGTHAR